MPQEIALYPELTARENLRYFGRLYGIPRRELAGRIGEVLATVGLTDRGDDKVEAGKKKIRFAVVDRGRRR